MGFLDAYSAWIDSGALSNAEMDELRGISEDHKELESRFYGLMEFGTGGMRGVMGLGLYRMNIHVVRHTTQALAELIIAEQADDSCVAVCFDPRINSYEFAAQAARVLAGNGIHVRIFESLRPTPELSFAIIQYGCIAGINITASHNPKEYNGYKVYWSDGAQMPPSHSSAVAKKMAETDMFKSIRSMDYDEAVSRGLIVTMGEETDELFLQNVMAQANDKEAVARVKDSFKMVYTPFHGAGYRLVPEALKRLGVKHVYCVAEQMEPDGLFPTVESPNPENPEGFKLAVALAEKVGAELIVGTDPDSDRVGVMVLDGASGFIPLTGNQTGVLLLDYIIGAKKRAGTMPERPVALKTIVTTEMARRVAEENGLRCFDTFTGFKFMAEKKKALEKAGEGKVIFSFEESYGYMLGDYVMDKDAVTASMLIAEMAAWYHGRGMTLADALRELFERYGYYGERTINLMMPGLDGLGRMRELMEKLRVCPPSSIAGTSVMSRRDYETGEEYLSLTGETRRLELSGSNVLRFDTGDGTAVIIRPSGTEPKVKVYILARGESRRECDHRLDVYSGWAESL